jgi:hypothetical protein
MINQTENLFNLVRTLSLNQENLDKKQLRFNEIVEVSQLFYNNPEDRVKELIESCKKGSSLYEKITQCGTP